MWKSPGAELPVSRFWRERRSGSGFNDEFVNSKGGWTAKSLISGSDSVKWLYVFESQGWLEINVQIDMNSEPEKLHDN